MRRPHSSRRARARCRQQRAVAHRRSRRQRRQGRISSLFLPPGLAAQLRIGYRLVRRTPGLPVYLCGGLAVWLACRTLAAQGLAAGPLGATLVITLRLCGLVLVVLLYFRRTGLLAEAQSDLHQLRVLLAERQPWRTEPDYRRRLVLRLLGWVLRARLCSMEEERQ